LLFRIVSKVTLRRGNRTGSSEWPAPQAAPVDAGNSMCHEFAGGARWGGAMALQIWSRCLAG
jgi:hypothetical protein